MQVTRAAARIPANSWTEDMGGKLGGIAEAAHSLMSALPVNAQTDHAREGFAGAWARQDPWVAAQWAEALSAESGAEP